MAQPFSTGRDQSANGRVRAVLGPTNTGKTHLAIERLCGHSSGAIGFPLRLLAREVYDRVVAIKGADRVALITGEERIEPKNARWLLCTAEAMPQRPDFAFVALDEAQLAADPERGHVFTDRLLHARGREVERMLQQWQRIWPGESFGYAGAIGPAGRPTLIVGGASDVAFARAARYADGWISGSGGPEEFGERVRKLRAAWRTAGREGEPLTQALLYFALGYGARPAAESYLTDYYAWLGPDVAQAIAGGAATDVETVRGYVDAFAAVIREELAR